MAVVSALPQSFSNSEAVSEFGVETFADRLNSLINGKRGVSAFARQCGIGDTTIRQYLAGAVPGLDKVVQIARATGVSITWLATGEGPRDSQVETSHVVEERTEREQRGVPVLHVSPSDVVPDTAFVSVPMLDVQFSAGPGLIAQSEEVSAYLAMESAFLRSLGISPAFARIVDVSGDSMYPTLRDRDRVVVDTSIDHVADEGLYAVILGNALLIKRLQIRLDGSIVLRSDNKAAGYEDVVVEGVELERLRIVGRVKIRIHLM